MKKIATLFVLALTMTISSCSKSDTAAPADPMLGQWIIDTYTSTTPTGTSDPKVYTSATCAPKQNYIFLQASSVLEMGTVDKNCAFTKTPGTWTLTNGLLTMNAGASGTMNMYVVSVTSSKLVLKMLATSDGLNYSTINLKK